MSKKTQEVIQSVGPNKVKKIASSRGAKKPVLMKKRSLNSHQRCVMTLERESMQAYCAKRMQSKKWEISASDFDNFELDPMSTSTASSEYESDYDYGYREDNWFNHDSGPGFTVDDLKKLAIAVRSLKRTQRIDIEFVLRKIEVEQLYHGLDILFESFKGLKTLKTLKITFSGGDLDDKGLEILSRGLEKLSFLRDLRIFFDECEHFTDKGIEILAKKLGKMTLLQNIYLDFVNCSGTSEEGLDDLRRALKEAKYRQSCYRIGVSQKEIKVVRTVEIQYY